MSTLSLTYVHAKANILETIRTPVAVISALAFPALMVVAFILPFSAEIPPEGMTIALTQVCVFAVFSTGLFNMGFGVAEARDKPWYTFVRTLPVGPIPQVVGRVIDVALIGAISIVPVLLLGLTLTNATITVPRFLAGLGALAVVGVPFLLIGTTIGYGLSLKAANGLITVTMFVLAFLGGLFMPVETMGSALEYISRFLPTRGGREFVIWAVSGGDLPWWVAANLLGWTLILGGATWLLFKRDQGKRFR